RGPADGIEVVRDTDRRRGPPRDRAAGSGGRDRMAGSAGRDTVGGAVGLSEAVEEPATGSGQLAGLRLAVDKTRPTPAYLQLSEQLTRSIEEGDLIAGSALPSERVLALDLGLSRMTVRRAFEELVAAGVVEQRQGSGTFVRPR